MSSDQVFLEPSNPLLDSSSNDEAEGIETAAGHRQQEPHLTFVNGLALVIGLQIGSGIFSAPAQVSAHVSSPTVAVSTWVVGGMLVYAGAAVFAELGIRLPYNGGIQEYLRHAYGDFCAFVFSWTWLVISKPTSMAVICTIFSDYVCRALLPAAWITPVIEKTVAFAGLTLITLINCFGVRSGARAATVFLYFKILILSSIIVSGLAFFFRSTPVITKPDEQRLQTGAVYSVTSTWSVLGDYITALFGALYCYAGWETIGFVAGEMKDPKRDLPKVLNTAMAIVIVGFVFYNVALYCVVPFQDVANTRTPIVEFELKVLGDAGVTLYSLLIAASALGSLNANVYATARVYVAAADKGQIPTFFSANATPKMSQDEVSFPVRLTFIPRSMQERLAKLSKTLSKPGGSSALRRAMTMNACLTTICILQGSFNSLVTFMGVSEYIFLFFTVIGIFTIRKKTATTEAPMAHKLSVTVFSLVSSFIVIRGIITSPIQGFAIGLLVGICWLMYRYRSV